MRWLQALFLIVLSAGASARGDYSYYVTDLGLFSPQAVNGQGVVVGSITNPYSPFATYSNGLVQIIAEPSDHSLSFNNITVATFTDDGTIAFAAQVFDNVNNTSRFGVPIIYKNGAFAVIPNVTGAQTTPNSWGINNAGQAAGVFTNITGSGQFAFDGTTTTITQGSNNFYGPNNLGERVGTIRQGFTSAAIDKNGTITALTNSRGDPVFLSGPSAINDNDYVIIGGSIGYVTGSLYTPLPLSGLLNGRYVSLSSNNTAVGLYQATTTATHAVYFDGTTAVDLNNLIDPTSEWTLTSATSISDTGYIIGQGVHDGATANFLLTPVPEPASAGVFIFCGMLALVRRRRRQTSIVDREKTERFEKAGMNRRIATTSIAAFLLTFPMTPRPACAQGISPIGDNVKQYVTGTMDSIYAWYEQGFNQDAPLTGLPHAGVSQINPNISFHFQPYDQNNVMLLNVGNPIATMTFTTPLTTTAIAIGVATGVGPAFLAPTLHFADGSPDYTPALISEPDWFNQTTNYLVNASGRVQIYQSDVFQRLAPTGSFDVVGSTAPKIQFDTFVLPDSIAIHPLASVTFSWSQTNTRALPYTNTAIFGIGTSSDHGATYIAGNLTAGSFNQDVVVEAAALPEPASTLGLAVCAGLLQRRRSK